MVKIRILFYKAKRGDGHWIDNAIDIWTWLISPKNRTVGPYGHVETGHPTTEPSEFEQSLVDLENDGYMSTSTMRGINNGSVMRPTKTVIENIDRWDVCEIEIEELDYRAMMQYLINEVHQNKGYSKRDILKFFGLGIFADKTRNICSEIVNNALYFAGVLDEMGVVSPRRLAYLLKQKGCEIKPLSA